MAVKAVFLDRDGTLIRHVHYLHEPEKVELLPGVRETLAYLLEQGVNLFLFTNQSGVARGHYTLDDVEAVNQRMVELIGLGDQIFTDICIATEMPSDAPVYRKPSPRFILESLAVHGIVATDAVMIGDNPTDWEAGERAGVSVVAINSPITYSSSGSVKKSHRYQTYKTLIDWANEVDPGFRAR